MTTATATVLGATASPLALRFCGGPRDGQIVRLASRKCTIGGAENCTLRLRAPTVRPVHCLILRGPSETVVRRWSGDTLLNGHAFNDAILTPGDRLRCGPVELEWVDESQDQGESARAVTQVLGRPARVNQTEVFERPARLNQTEILDGHGPLDEERTALEAEKRRWQEERRREEHQLDEQRRQVEALLAKQLARVKAFDAPGPAGQGLGAASTNPNVTQVMTQPITPRPTAEAARVVELEAELAQLREEVERMRTELTSKQAAFEQEVAVWTNTASQERGQIVEKAEEVRVKSEQLRQQLEQFGQDSERLRRQAEQLNESRSALDADTERLQAAQADLTERGEKWATEQKMAEEVWARRLDELERRAAELDRREAELAARAADLDAAESRAAQMPPAYQPSSFALPDEQEEEPAEEPAPQGVTPTRAAGNDDEEQSIEQYMSALLHRVGGHSTRSEPSIAQSAAAPVQQSGEPASVAATEPPAALTRRAPAAERVPRKGAPENTESLAAMRDLANLNTRVALDRYGKRRMLAAAWMKAGVAIAAFATSVWIAHGPRGTTILGEYGVWVTFVVGVVYAWLFAQTMRRRSSSKESIQKLIEKTASTLAADGAEPRES